MMVGRCVCGKLIQDQRENIENPFVHSWQSFQNLSATFNLGALVVQKKITLSTVVPSCRRGSKIHMPLYFKKTIRAFVAYIYFY